jgi:hypothetical protein
VGVQQKSWPALLQLLQLSFLLLQLPPSVLPLVLRRWL